MKKVLIIWIMLFFWGCDSGRYQDNNAVKLNQIQLIGSHNSYKLPIERPLFELLEQRDSARMAALDYGHPDIEDQLDLGLRKIELDVFFDPDGGKFSEPFGLKMLEEIGQAGNVYDSLGELNLPGFKVMHVQDIDFRSHSLLFKNYLKRLKTWSIENPGHFPVFITLNAKDGNPDNVIFTQPEPFTSAAFDALDEEIRSVFMDRELFVPEDLKGNYPTLEEAVLAKEWPHLDDVNGKFIFILDEDGKKLADYIEGHPSLDGRTMFVNAKEGNPEAAFRIINDPIKEEKYIKNLVDKGYIVRTRADSDTREARLNLTEKRNKAFSSGAQLISTDYYLPDERYNSGYQVIFEDGTYFRKNPAIFPESERSHYSLDENTAFKSLKPGIFQKAISPIGVQLVDVRTDAEFQNSYIANAVQMDFQNADFEGMLDQLDKNKPVFLYCKVGGRSAKAAGLLKDLGFNSVYHLDGGIDAWIKEKKEITASEGEPGH